MFFRLLHNRNKPCDEKLQWFDVHQNLYQSKKVFTRNYFVDRNCVIIAVSANGLQTSFLSKRLIFPTSLKFFNA